MAKLPALVNALTEVDERERPTLDHFARVIREAGLIPTTKRGSGAADMTTREATNMLIAVNTADSPKLAPVAVTHYRSLKGMNYGPVRKPEGIFGRINDASNFGEALEVLIEGAPEIQTSFSEFIDNAYSNYPEEVRATFKNGTHLANVEVSFSRPYPYAEIRVVAPGMNTPVQYEWKYMVDTTIFMAGGYRVAEKDRKTTVTVHLKTLLALSATVANMDDAE